MVTISNLFPLEVVQKCQLCQLGVVRENSDGSINFTRMHSSRMRTAHLLTVSHRIPHRPPLCNHTCPPTTMYAPHNHTCPPTTMYAPHNHACLPTTTHAPCNHACPPQPCTFPWKHAPPWEACIPQKHAPPGSTQTPKEHARPRCGQTHACKHITLPQASFSGGNNVVHLFTMNVKLYNIASN